MSQYHSGSRPLAIRRLAQRVIRDQDQNAAIVLGDYQHEARLPYIETGRTRSATFRIDRVGIYSAVATILSNKERGWFDRLRTSWAFQRGGQLVFQIPTKERIYNLDSYAAKPDERTWRQVYAVWEMPPRPTYRALVHTGVLPRSIRVGELREHNFTFDDDRGLIKQLYLQRDLRRGGSIRAATSKRSSRPTDFFLMAIRHLGPITKEYPGRPEERR